MLYQKMKILIQILVLLAPALVWGGDVFLTPDFQEGSAYESTEPKYRVIGINASGRETIVWVVATREDVLSQKGVNRIIGDIRRQHRTEAGKTGLTAIWFYSSVGDQPKFPSFRITDHLAVYYLKENKTYYGPAAKDLYGSWAHGPFSRN